MAVQNILVSGKAELVEVTLGSGSLPGMGLEVTPTTGVARPASVSGNPTELLILVENDASGMAVARVSGKKANAIVPAPGSVVNVLTKAGSAAAIGAKLTVDASGYFTDVAAIAGTAPAAQTQSGINNSGLTGTPSNTAGSGINIDALNVSGLSGTPDNAPVDVANPTASGTMESGHVITINKNFKELADQAVTQRALNTVILNDLATVFTQLALVKNDVAAVRVATSGAITALGTARTRAIALAARDSAGFTKVRIV